MNVIVSNKQKDIIDNANIDAIKDLNGLFNVDDLISKFKNYFFSKMILDATSVVNFTMPEVLEKLVQGIGSDKLIILLPQQPEPPREFIDKLISLNIHQFSTNIDDILKFVNNNDKSTNNNDLAFNDNSNIYPNNDGLNPIVNNVIVDNVSPTPNYNSSETNIGIVDNAYNNSNNSELNYNANNVGNYDNNLSYSDVIANMNVNNMQQGNVLDVSNNPYDISKIPYNNTQVIESEPVQNQVSSEDYLVGPALTNTMQAINNQGTNDFSVQNGVPYNTVNSSNNAAYPSTNGLSNNLNQGLEGQSNMFIQKDFYNVSNLSQSRKMVLGIINVTEHAGSTTLTYLIKKTLEEQFHKTVSAIEINKNDFIVYRNNKMFSVKESDLKESIDKLNDEFIIVDLNDTNNISLCDDVLYLIEPSLIKVNKLMVMNSSIFQSLVNKKVILNQSFLSNSDVEIFGREAGIKIFMNIPPLNDRVNNEIIFKLIALLNIN